VGTTAGYYEEFYRFRRTTRAEFLALWRSRRGAALERPGVLGEACTDVRSLLEAAREVAPSRTN
jgi:hypothetical protein